MRDRLGAKARLALEIFCHFLWPSTCPVCGRLGKDACPSCLDHLLVQMPARCLACSGGPFPCQVPSHTAFLRAGALHEGKAKEIVHLAKYAGRRTLAFEMGKALARLYIEDPAEILIPVPLHIDSKRSYNQAAWLARGMGEVWNASVVEGLKWARPFPSQVGRNAFERRALEMDAFRWEGPSVKGSAVLVDDVFTTGTTLLRASGALNLAGIAIKGAYCWGRSSAESVSVSWREEKPIG